MRLAVLLAIALAVGAGAASARSGPPPCSEAAANAAIRASVLPREVKDLTRQHLAGVDQLICHDLTADGRTDMAVTLASGGTAGDVAWAAFVRTGPAWRLAGANADGYKVGLFLHGRDLVEAQPIYRKNDPNCCPTGGFAHRRLHWNGH